METWIVFYEDDGPNGPCGQCMSIMSNWSRIHIFDDYDNMKAFCEWALGSGRKNPRVKVVDKIFVHKGDDYTEFGFGEPIAIFRRLR